MKLELTLPEKPAFLHVLPVFDILGLVMIFILIGPTFMAESGIEIEQPATSLQLQRYENPIIITATAGESPAVYVNENRSSLKSLSVDLNRVLETGPWKKGDVAIIKADIAIVVAVQNRIISSVRRAGLRPAIGYRSERN